MVVTNEHDNIMGMWKTPDTANLQIFSFNEKESTPIRVQVIDNEPWFVAKDVCRVLGIANHKDAVSRVDDDERRGVGITDPLGGRQQATAVNESGRLVRNFWHAEA